MLRNLCPSLRSSAITTSSPVFSMSSRTRLLPMKPAPPVTMYTARSFLLAQVVLGPAVRALGLARLADRQVHPGMRVPQVHSGHGTGQRKVLRPHLVAVLRVGGNELLVDRACP